ncbi:MAG TPA: carboxypeptidase-like regulatory domain-containing protein, partial [Chitinophagaceae bacterium]|nr:carboxypeptidase-like regulatory domain-containing protein [Chitinophagaceae bacterium]
KLEGKASGVLVQDKRYLFLNNNALKDFQGSVTDNNSQPVPNAIVSLNNRRAVYTDAKGYFKLQAPDSLLNVNVSSVGYITRDALLKSNYANNIVIVPDKNSLSEVVVTDFATKKKALNRITNADSAYPSGGWESFQEYVYKKLGKPLDTLNNNETDDDVQVEFSIDKNGAPYNFHVLKSTNDATASKAIEIIKEGPRWITTHKNKKGKVTIQF